MEWGVSIVPLNIDVSFCSDENIYNIAIDGVFDDAIVKRSTFQIYVKIIINSLVTMISIIYHNYHGVMHVKIIISTSLVNAYICIPHQYENDV